MAAQVLMNFKLSFFFLSVVNKINLVRIDTVAPLFMFTDFFLSLKLATACRSCTSCLPDQMMISSDNCQSAGSRSLLVTQTEAFQKSKAMSEYHKFQSHCCQNGWNVESISFLSL